VDQIDKPRVKKIIKSSCGGSDYDSICQINSVLLDNISDSILLFDFKGNIIYANETWCRVYGYTKQEVPGINLFHHVIDHNECVLEDHFAELEETGRASFESMYLCKDGSCIPVEVNVRIVEINDKKLLLSVVRTIAERKKTVAELKLKEQILDKASDAIMLRDLQGKIVYANEEAYRARGYTKEEFIGENLFELLPSNRARESKQKMHETLQKGNITFESIYTRRDNTPVPAEFHMNTIGIGDDTFILSVIRDLSWRKKAENELRLKEQILDSATDSILLREPEGKIVYANEIAYTSLGYSRDEFIGINIQQLLTYDETRLFTSRERENDEQGTITFESTHVRKDGSIMPVEVKSSKVVSDNKLFYLAFIKAR